MPSKVALVVFDRCHPEECGKGICLAVGTCSHRLIKQEAPHDIPMFHPGTCQGCGECVAVCPLRAIKIVRL